ncbi:MAG: hypothetical protein OIF54_16060, partial [Cohaesibacter sp.]|nr:hypothetical protein [Cohaesibacter sp.]
ASARSDNAGAFSFLMRTFCIELSRQFNEARPRKTTQLSEPFQGILWGNRSCRWYHIKLR